MTWQLWVSWVALAFNIGLCVINFRLFVRRMRLEMLLRQVILMAFVNRHMPIWVPWCVAHGMMIRIEIDPMPPRRRARENWGR